MKNFRNKIRLFVLKTQVVDMYGLPALLLLFLFFSIIAKSEFYVNNYVYLDIIFNCGLVMGCRELYTTYYCRKCEWQELSCYCLIILGLFNLISKYLIKDIDVDSDQYDLYLNWFRAVNISILLPFIVKVFIKIYNEEVYGK